MNRLKFRLLVSDIDGTLLSTNNTLDQETINSIDEYRQAGGLFTIATGRNFLHTKAIIEQLQIDTPVIVSDGAIVYDPLTREKQILSNFPRKQLHWIAEQCQEISTKIDVFFFSYQIETDDHRIYSISDSPLIHQYADDWLYTFSFVSSFAEIPMNTDIINMFIHIKEPKTIAPFRTWCKQHLTEYHVNFWSEEFVSIAPQSSNKGAAILSLCEQLKLPTSKVAAIGDHLNDLPMLKMAGFFAAMGNGESRVRESARLIVPRNDEHGVAYFIRHHLLAESS